MEVPALDGEKIENSFNKFVAKTYMWIVIGLLIAGVTGVISYQQGWWNSIGILAGAFILTITMIIVMYFTNNKTIEIPAFILFNIGLGVDLGYIPAYYSNATIAQGVILTSLIFILFSIIAWKKPEYFKGTKIAILLFISLLTVIIIEFAMMFINPAFVGNPYWNALVALIFIGFILYDTSKLKDWYHNGYSEIDCAVSFILDFINLLIRILDILGSDKD